MPDKVDEVCTFLLLQFYTYVSDFTTFYLLHFKPRKTIWSYIFALKASFSMLLVRQVLFVLVSTTTAEDTALNMKQQRLIRDNDIELILEPDFKDQISMTTLRVTCITDTQQERTASHIPPQGVQTIRIKRQSRYEGVA